MKEAALYGLVLTGVNRFSNADAKASYITGSLLGCITAHSVLWLGQLAWLDLKGSNDISPLSLESSLTSCQLTDTVVSWWEG